MFQGGKSVNTVVFFITSLQFIIIQNAKEELTFSPPRNVFSVLYIIFFFLTSVNSIYIT
jgi:hypothetical protein